MNSDEHYYLKLSWERNGDPPESGWVELWHSDYLVIASLFLWDDKDPNYPSHEEALSTIQLFNQATGHFKENKENKDE